MKDLVTRTLFASAAALPSLSVFSTSNKLRMEYAALNITNKNSGVGC